MRYLIVRYLKKPNGQMDELVAVSKKIKLSDAACAAVILDYKLRRVEKAHLDGNTVPRDFERISAFYRQHYPSVIKQLEAMHAPPAPVTPDKAPISS